MEFVIVGSDDLTVADPCAGAGDALVGITERWLARATYEKRHEWDRARSFEHWSSHAKLFGCEMEGQRAASLARKLGTSEWGRSAHGAALHGDAFMIQLFRGEGVRALWLNPPYDVDREYKRLEERWLLRFTQLVEVGGALLFFVPYYALAASAETLACNFDSLACYRLPEPHYAAFKQVVLVGRRRERLAVADPTMRLRVALWAEEPGCIPVLPLEGLEEPAFTVRTDGRANVPRWQMGILDTTSMFAKYEPWTITDRAGRRQAVPNISPAEPFAEIMAPRVTLGCAPRPAHIALAAGAGVLSGARLTPDVPGSGPELLLKGVHRRAYHHTRWKENAKGERMAEEREQRPELHMSVLDLAAGKYHRLRQSMDPTPGDDVSTWTVGDLLERYGGSMLTALRDRCDILYDQTNPEHIAAYPLVQVSPDPLLHAQEHATRAVLRLLDEPDRAAVLLGQIGVGKTRISLTAAVHALRIAFDYLHGRGRVLVMCPPLLLAEWRSEVTKVLPGARVAVLDSNEAIDEEAGQGGGFSICLMSKEAAKLGHAHVGLRACGKCGSPAKETAEKNAARRLFCEATTYQPANRAARIALFLAERLGTVFPDAQLRSVVHMAGGRILRRAVDRAAAFSPDWRTREDIVRRAVRALRRTLVRTRSDEIAYAWWSMMHALADETLIVEEARALFRSTLSTRDDEYGPGRELREFAGKTLLLLPPSSPWICAVLAEFGRYRGRTYDKKLRAIYDTWPVEKANRSRRRGVKMDYNFSLFEVDPTSEAPAYGGRVWGSDDALRYAIERIVASATWTESDECGEPLYQAVPQPRRIPLAQYLIKRHPTFFDFLVLDEIHQLSGNGSSAQSHAAQQLLNLRRRRGIPAIGLTGSAMNGYARSLFVLLWHFSARFREVFAHNDVGEFERRFGFLVQVVEKRNEEGERVSFGTHSDRILTSARTTGAAPGVVPTAVLKYLLPCAVTIQLSDLEHDLPPVVDRVAFVTPTEEQRGEARRLETKLLSAIAADRFKEGRAGKLFGPMGHLPRYLDHATRDTGNWPDGSWTIAYPEDCVVGPGERVVARAPGFEPDTVLPKEAELLSQWVARAVGEGRNFVVATTRTALAARLHRILTAQKIPTALLDAKKVSAAKRRDWITSVREKGIPGLIANPQALPVGLNNLAGYYSRVFLFDDPNNDPTLLRQFRGRFVRIGQTTDVEIVSLVYEGTLQEAAHDLLQKKRIIAEATDGLDASAAFQVVGVGDALAFETDLGKAIYARLVTTQA